MLGKTSLGVAQNRTRPIFSSGPGHLPYLSVHDFWKIKFEISGLTNLNFNLQKSILKLTFAGYTSSKNSLQNRVCLIWFFQLDFSKINYRWIGRLWYKDTWTQLQFNVHKSVKRYQFIVMDSANFKFMLLHFETSLCWCI